MNTSMTSLLSFGSLADLELLPQVHGNTTQRLTLQYISSMCDIPQTSECIEAVGRPLHDKFLHDMEGIVYGKQSQTKGAPMEAEELCDGDNVSTSLNSQEAAIQQGQNTSLPKKTGCSCKKTGCLKMYCQCFSSGLTCGQHCGCANCSNHVDNTEQIEKAREVAKHRFRQAYFNPVDGGIKKRCNCRKTQCQKKYCECFNMGLPCNELCKCQGCQNVGHRHGPDDPTQQLLC